MPEKIFQKIYDHRRSDSWASQLRKKRGILLESLIASLPSPVRILDVGGRPVFWEQSGFINQDFREIEVTIVNLEPYEHPHCKCLVGDATNLHQFQDKEFDIVFSNSVIEHVGAYNSQLQMANEIMRVGKRYFVQTPNLYFPIEPHFLFPLFQFLPTDIKVWLLRNFSMGWYPKISNEHKARDLATNTKLLSKKKLLSLFPKSNLYEEKIFGVAKSFIVYQGF